jgi:hypothetical protein
VVKDLTAANQTMRANDWYAGVLKTKRVVIGIPAVNAFMIQEDDIDRGLAEFERLFAEDEGTDPYLAYYIGRSTSRREARRPMSERRSKP